MSWPRPRNFFLAHVIDRLANLALDEEPLDQQNLEKIDEAMKELKEGRSLASQEIQKVLELELPLCSQVLYSPEAAKALKKMPQETAKQMKEGILSIFPTSFSQELWVSNGTYGQGYV